jgi:hypothetical protein
MCLTALSVILRIVKRTINDVVELDRFAGLLGARARSFKALPRGVYVECARDGGGRFPLLRIGWQALLHVPSLSARLWRRGRIEAYASSSILPLGGFGSTTSKAAGSATNGLPHVPLSFLCEPEENGRAS